MMRMEENVKIVHMATQEWWRVDYKGGQYSVRKHDHWQSGEQTWTVYKLNEEETSPLLSEEERHEVVRCVQEHLLRR